MGGKMDDLPTERISLLSYFSIYGGVEGLPEEIDIDVSEMLECPRVEQNILYDNGVEGIYRGHHGNEIYFRAKQDGWVMAWYPIGFLQFKDQDRPDNRGIWDFILDWDTGDYRQYRGFQKNSLERAIRDLVSTMSIWNMSEFEYDPFSCYLHLFNYPDDATNVGFFGHNLHEKSEGIEVDWNIGDLIYDWYMPYRIRGTKHQGTPNQADAVLKFKATFSTPRGEVTEEDGVLAEVHNDEDHSEKEEVGVVDLVQEEGIHTVNPALDMKFVCAGSGSPNQSNIKYYTSSYKMSSMVVWG